MKTESYLGASAGTFPNLTIENRESFIFRLNFSKLNEHSIKYSILIMMITERNAVRKESVVANIGTSIFDPRRIICFFSAVRTDFSCNMKLEKFAFGIVLIYLCPSR